MTGIMQSDKEMGFLWHVKEYKIVFPSKLDKMSLGAIIKHILK